MLQEQGLYWFQGWASMFARVARDTGWYDIVHSMVATFAEWDNMVLSQFLRLITTIGTTISIGFLNYVPLGRSQVVDSGLAFCRTPAFPFGADLFRVCLCPSTSGFGVGFTPLTLIGAQGFRLRLAVFAVSFFAVFAHLLGMGFQPFGEVLTAIGLDLFGVRFPVLLTVLAIFIWVCFITGSVISPHFFTVCFVVNLMLGYFTDAAGVSQPVLGAAVMFDSVGQNAST